jgi:hypothetical protein
MVGSSRAIDYEQMGNASKLDVIWSSEGSSCSSSSIVKHSIFSCLFSRTTIFHLSTFSAFVSSSAFHQRTLPLSSLAPPHPRSQTLNAASVAPRMARLSQSPFPCPILTPPPLPPPPPTPCRYASNPACSSTPSAASASYLLHFSQQGHTRGHPILNDPSPRGPGQRSCSQMSSYP